MLQTNFLLLCPALNGFAHLHSMVHTAGQLRAFKRRLDDETARGVLDAKWAKQLMADFKLGKDVCEHLKTMLPPDEQLRIGLFNHNGEHRIACYRAPNGWPDWEELPVGTDFASQVLFCLRHHVLYTCFSSLITAASIHQ